MSRDQAAVLAIDGGNSKTDIALVAADGTLLAAGRGPGVRTFPTPEVLAAIGAVIGAAAQEAGLPPGWPVADAAVACMANADLPEEEERLAAMITAAGWSTSTVVANDTFAVLRAGLDTPRGLPWGVAVTCGAGIMYAPVYTLSPRDFRALSTSAITLGEKSSSTGHAPGTAINSAIVSGQLTWRQTHSMSHRRG